jgi:hypothetical protein
VESIRRKTILLGYEGKTVRYSLRLTLMCGIIANVTCLNTSAPFQFHTWQKAVRIALNRLTLVATICSTFLNIWHLRISPTEDIHEFCLVLKINTYNFLQSIIRLISVKAKRCVFMNVGRELKKTYTQSSPFKACSNLFNFRIK